MCVCMCYVCIYVVCACMYVCLVGPIHPLSEKGHRYIFTLVDYATRYPEAIPLKSISTEAVAEALVDIYSRLGVPEEVLSDMGTLFVSECMKEVSRLLRIRQLTTTPYPPMCNGLVEKFNGTLKTMLQRLCTEQPKQWYRYINALLFAYQEVPQESTHFSPFELLYGRTVWGPMYILKELWTNDVKKSEVKNSYQYVFELRERLDQTLKIACEAINYWSNGRVLSISTVLWVSMTTESGSKESARPTIVIYLRNMSLVTRQMIKKQLMWAALSWRWLVQQL